MSENNKFPEIKVVGEIVRFNNKSNNARIVVEKVIMTSTIIDKETKKEKELVVDQVKVTKTKLDQNGDPRTTVRTSKAGNQYSAKDELSIFMGVEDLVQLSEAVVSAK